MLIDEAIDLDAAACERWLDALEGSDRELRPTLRRLLLASAERSTADLLDRGLVFRTPPEADVAFSAGQAVGPYRLVSQLGEGGMGEVWLAERADGSLQRPVALKLPLLQARRTVLVQRFARERDILAGLTHPHIARLYDAGIADDGQPFLAIEYIEGERIDRWCERQALPAAGRIALLRQVMDAVQHAHAHLVIHRDLKPGNVLVDRHGRAVLLDFGIAKLLEGDAATGEATALTRVGGQAMTPHYAAPEQLTGTPVSTATDVWALGVLLHELVSGRRPFTQEQRGALEQAILHDDPPRPSAGGVALALSRGAAAELDAIVAKALQKAPADRYATVAAFADDLDRWTRGDVVLARPAGSAYRTLKFVRRHRLAVATAAGVAHGVIGASMVALRQAEVARNEAQTALAVQDFISGVFQASDADQADPVRARQRTAVQLLDEGAARIQGSLDDVPAAKVRVLQVLATQYEGMALFNQVAQLQQRIAALAEKLPGGGSTQRLDALTAEGGALTKAGRHDAGRAALDQAEALLGTQGGPRRNRLDLAWATYYTERNDPQGLRFTERVLAALGEDGSPDLRLEALYLHGTLLGLADRSGEARAVLQRAAALGPEVKGGWRTEIPTLMHLATLSQRPGDGSQAEAAFRRAVELSTQRAGPAAPQTVIVLGRLGQFLGSAGRLGEAVDALGEASGRALAWTDAAERASHAPYLLTLEGRTLIAFGRAEAALQRLDAATGLATEADPAQFVWLLGTRAQALAEVGSDTEAREAIEATLAQVERHGLRNTRAGYWFRRVEVMIALDRGDLQTAAGRWQALRGEPAFRVDVLPAAPLAAEVALGTDVPQAALDAARQMLATLATQAPGLPRSASEARLRGVEGLALLRLGRPNESATALRDAVRLYATFMDNEQSLPLAAARLRLGQALVATGDRVGASEELAAARAAHARHARLASRHLSARDRLEALLKGAAQPSR